jgi:MFS family permease
VAPDFQRINAAQFLSALADNALLIVAIALLQRSAQPASWVPLLKFFFIVSYVVLAPVVGVIADAMHKARLMAWMNALKGLGAFTLAAGWHPLLAFTVIGICAATYSPAKLGLVTESVDSRQLVTANAWIEASVVTAVLLGTAGGGYLVSQEFADGRLAAWLTSWGHTLGIARAGLAPALLVILTLYGAAQAAHGAIQRRGTTQAHSMRPRRLLHEFVQANRTLWRDREGGRLALSAAILFWGASAVMQFAVLRWATDRIGLSLTGAAYLQTAVAVGLIAGAWCAGRRIALLAAPRALWAGVGLGLLVAAGPWCTDAWWAAVLMFAIGTLGGALLVPMNALLQHRGSRLLGAGRSIAVQGFNENASVLLMLGVHTGTVAIEVPIAPLMVAFGLLVTSTMALLIWRSRSLLTGPCRARVRTAVPASLLDTGSQRLGLVAFAR